MTPSQSLFRGPIGALSTLPLNRATRAYYERQGVSVDGRLFEDLMESELFLILEKIFGWLPPGDRRTLDEAAAFGLCSTHEPNACAMRCFDGHALLIDFALKTRSDRGCLLGRRKPA